MRYPYSTIERNDMQIDLSGKIALVTALTAGIGHAIALGLAKAGSALRGDGGIVDSIA
jgi:NADP-dependent 3-hydroxy acid dehydrogenase YdfG